MTGTSRVCPECGREWSDKVIFCMGCGARTVEKTDVIIERKISETAPAEKIVSQKVIDKEIIDEAKLISTTDKIPDIEDLILAYLRKVSGDYKSEKFIEQVREIVNR